MALTEWAGFFEAEVSASATLTGLVTVAISINLARILSVEHLPSRAGESLFALTAAFALSSAALIPGISLPALGVVALIVAALSFGFGARNQYLWRTQVGRQEWLPQTVNAVCRTMSTLPITIGGALLCFHAPAGVDWIGVGVIATLVVSVMNAWVLLVEIIR